MAHNQKVIEDKDTLLNINKARIFHLKGDMLDKSEKLKKADKYVAEQKAKTTWLEEELKKAQAKMAKARATMDSLRQQLSSLSKLVETLRAECTEAY